MPVFPRTLKPKRSSTPKMPGPLVSVAQSGKVNTRSRTQVGRTWTESFFFEIDSAGKAFLAQIQNWHRNGTVLSVQHQDNLTNLGQGGGTPLVNGANQTGQSLITDGWPNNTAILLAGDYVRMANIATVYDVTADVTSDGSGNATLSINPPIFSGSSPADNATIAITNAILYTAIISQLDLPEFGPETHIAFTLGFRETP